MPLVDVTYINIASYWCVCVLGGGGVVSGKWERDVAVCCLRYWTVKYLSYILYVQLPPPLSTSTNDALMV